MFISTISVLTRTLLAYGLTTESEDTTYCLSLRLTSLEARIHKHLMLIATSFPRSGVGGHSCVTEICMNNS